MCRRHHITTEMAWSEMLRHIFKNVTLVFLDLSICLSAYALSFMGFSTWYIVLIWNSNDIFFWFETQLNDELSLYVIGWTFIQKEWTPSKSTPELTHSQNEIRSLRMKFHLLAIYN